MEQYKNANGIDIEAQLAIRGNMINDLEKQIRFNELNFKKRLIELENELRNEQRRSQELHDEFRKNLKDQGDYELIKNMNVELQEKLTEHEDLILNQRSKEHSLNQQIRSLKESLNSKNAHSTSSPYSSSQSPHNENRSNSKKAATAALTTPSSLSSKRAAIKGFTDSPEASNENIDQIDKKDLIRAILDLTQEKEGLESELEKIREGAIDAIMEKERIIIELREQAFEESDTSSLLLKLESMRQEKDEWDDMHARVVENYERMLVEVHGKLDAESHRFEERLLSIESEINERVMSSFQSNLESAKDAEHDLMVQLKSSEDRLRFIEKSFVDQTKVLAHMKESYALAADEIADLKNQLALTRTQKERIQILERDVLAAEKSFKKESESKQETIEKLTRRVNELLKNCVSLETDAKRSSETLEAAHDQVDRLNNELAVLQLKFDDAASSYDREIAAIKNRFADEKRASLLMVAPTTPTPRSQVSKALSTHRSKSKLDSKSYLSTEKQQFKENLDPRQSSCLKTDLGGIADFNSAFDSPEIGIKKRIQSNQQSKQHLQQQPTRWGQCDDEGDHLQAINSSNEQENNEAVHLLIDSFPLREITSNVIGTNLSLTNSNNNSNRNGMKKIGVSKEIGVKSECENSIRGIGNTDKTTLIEMPCPSSSSTVAPMAATVFAASESYEEEFGKLQQELRVAYKQMQDYRRSLAEHIAGSNERECALKCELESLKTHIYKIETHMITYKLQYEEDNNFLKEELRIAERIAAESKVKVASLAQDKDYFHQKYKNLLAQSKGSKVKDSSSTSNGLLRRSKDQLDHQTTNFIVF